MAARLSSIDTSISCNAAGTEHLDELLQQSAIHTCWLLADRRMTRKWQVCLSLKILHPPSVGAHSHNKKSGVPIQVAFQDALRQSVGVRFDRGCNLHCAFMLVLSVDGCTY
jgi:hypothetical protein